MLRYISLFLFISLLNFAKSNPGSSEIYVNAQKLQSLKRVLYVAAHPDDENTRALAWFSLSEKAETAYFSLTRGDGGQNLIGDELSDDLGVLRTQELLAARSYDGAKQYFSRAVDFGYSKSAEESFKKWNKEEILSDLVLMIRKFKPDVIITRFPPDERAGHGHHTASALLAIEAFDKAADENYLPEQVKTYGTWQSTSVYWNTSYWWDKDLETLSEGDANYIIKDIGGYNAQLGMSYNEIGTHARSQHKCQGFGGILERGTRIEYFKHLSGTKLKQDFFENSTQSWTTIINSKFEKKLSKAIETFDFVDVTKNIPVFLDILKDLQKMDDSFFKTEKIQRCKQIILDCSGIYSELLGEDYSFVSGNSTSLNLDIINRSDVNIRIKKVELSTGELLSIDTILPLNKHVQREIRSSGDVDLSTPYWLTQSHGDLFTVNDQSNLGKAQSDPTISAKIYLIILGQEFCFEVPAEYKWRDPAYGERRRPLIASPSFTATPSQSSVIIKTGESKKVKVKIESFVDSLIDVVSITPVEGWLISPMSFNVEITHMHGEQWFEIELTPQKSAKPIQLHLRDGKGNQLFSYTSIEYDHIPTQTIYKQSSIKCNPLNVEIIPGKIAYIKGVEDAVPTAIEQLGFDVDLFEVSDLSNVELSSYSAVVLGIRIYNVHPEINNFKEKLDEYVQQGGKIVVQYNTASRSKKTLIDGPIPFEVSRKRVTEEDAEVTFLAPDHPIMTTPNKIVKSDFDGWVQERGLYFAHNWDKQYTPLFSWSDTGEEPLEGALIVTEYGQGQYIYTGISFFRELPNGVIGAYRLFANILSY